jgi:two-component system CheB/CheR fusion protein
MKLELGMQPVKKIVDGKVAAADLQNILNCSDVATVFLDNALNIRFFTPAPSGRAGWVAKRSLHGPLSHIASSNPTLAKKADEKPSTSPR